MARRITHIVIHCSATRPEFDIGVDEIRALHVSHESVLVPWDGESLAGRNWQDVGYHYVIRRDGTVENGRPESRTGAHVYGHNRNSVGICMVGGVAGPDRVPEANFTRAQWGALDDLVQDLAWKYSDAEVLGHRDFLGVHKACPSFDARSWWNAKGSK